MGLTGEEILKEESTIVNNYLYCARLKIELLTPKVNKGDIGVLNRLIDSLSRCISDVNRNCLTER